ncbi:MAG: tetratricopeptide repeat protein [Proteobacteria bacterium]|nr:tetratricopeptide repeat protein [Pseudomonadota bacterium]
MDAKTFIKALFVAMIAAAGACSPAVRLPGVHEAIDSAEWRRCAGELEKRESVAMIDDLTLDAQTMLCQGVVLAAAGKTDEGLELLTESGVRDKSDHRPHYLSGRILAQAGRYEESLTAFSRSAKRFPSMEVPTERLGRQLLDENGAQEARLFLEKARKRELCLYGCKGLLARLLSETGESKQAEAVYKEMIADNPAEPAAYVGLAGLQNKASKHREEADFLEQAKQTKHFEQLGESGQADILYSLAFARYNAREYTAAAAVMERAITLKSDLADWHILAGWIEMKRDRPETAASKFEMAISLNSRLGAAHAGLGDARVAMKEPSKALADYEKARELDPTNAVFVLKLALASALAGDLDRARLLIDEAARLDKEHLPPDLLLKVTDLVKE